MSLPAEKSKNKLYSYKDYLNFPKEERWEIIEGVLYNMTPAPSKIHQEVLLALASIFYNHLKCSDCKVYVAPFDVRLLDESTNDEDIKTVVQPDIVVVCDQKKLDDAGCIGSPDIVVEIVSPSTASKDYIKKLELYEKHKIKEYWIVHPVDRVVMIYKIGENGLYDKPNIYDDKGKVVVTALNGTTETELTIDVGKVFS